MLSVTVSSYDCVTRPVILFPYPPGRQGSLNQFLSFPLWEILRLSFKPTFLSGSLSISLKSRPLSEQQVSLQAARKEDLFVQHSRQVTSGSRIISYRTLAL